MAKQLAPFPLIAPGFRGLNKQFAAGTSTVGPDWAIELQNAVFDDAGRVAARKGWEDTFNAQISGSPDIEQTHEYVKADGTTQMILAADDKLFSVEDVRWVVFDGVNDWARATSAITTPTAIEVHAHVSPTDISTAGTIAAHWRSTAGRRGFKFVKNLSSNFLQVFISEDGTTIATGVSTEEAPLISGERLWLRFTWSVASQLCTFYYSINGIAWTQLGTQVPIIAAAINSVTVEGHTVGAHISSGGSNESPWAASIYRVKFFDEIDASDPVLDFNPNDWITGNSWTTPQAMWTILDGGVITPTSAKKPPPSTAFDITGALSYAGNDWHLQNFNDKVIGAKLGETPIVRSANGNFASIVASSGTIPTGGVSLSAFGRMWIVDSTGTVIQYSDLLDETEWDNAGSGSIDLSNVWTLGQDHIMGLAAFGATLVVFGQKHVIMYVDGQGSVLGIDPTQMYVVDTIEGTGLLAQDTIQLIGEGDLWYLSPTGVQSLNRVIAEKNNPTVSVSRNVRDYLKSFVDKEADITKAKSLFSPENRFYLLILPEQKQTFMFDTTVLMEDGSARAAEWPGFAAKDGTRRLNGDIVFGFDGRLGKYTGFDDNDVQYTWKYNSPHLDLGEDFRTREKILKNIGAVLFSQALVNFVFKWGFNFEGLDHTLTVAPAALVAAEYGTAEFGSNGVYDATDGDLVAGTDVSEYNSGDAVLRKIRIPASGRGQFIQLGLEVTLNSSTVALQQFTVYAKAGRVA